MQARGEVTFDKAEASRMLYMGIDVTCKRTHPDDHLYSCGRECNQEPIRSIISRPRKYFRIRWAVASYVRSIRSDRPPSRYVR